MEYHGSIGDADIRTMVFIARRSHGERRFHIISNGRRTTIDNTNSNIVYNGTYDIKINRGSQQRSR